MAKKKTFEQSITELEGIVRSLESGSATLEESLELFEKGTALTRECKTLLDSAEKKVAILMADSEGNMQAEPFPDMNE